MESEPLLYHLSAAPVLHFAKYALLTAFTLNCFGCTTVTAQNISDSLATKLRNASSDSVRARTILDIGEGQEATSIESSMHYYNMALAIAERIRNNHLILSSVN